MAAERGAEFPAMGSVARVQVTGDAALVALARRRIDDLERRWSRFLPDSEVSRLNRARGCAVPVSAETFRLVGRAVNGWRATQGRFDPTVLGDVVRAGYDRPFAAVVVRPGAGVSLLHRDCGGIVLDAAASTVTLPRDVGFDPGGLGKGLAADLVVAEVMAAGADGVSVSIGGDLRAEGVGPDGDWVVTVDHPPDRRVATVAIVAGAVATSTTRLRAWTVAGAARHHLIDPRTGDPSAGPVVAVSVVAREAVDAEVAATSALVADGGVAGALLAIDALGCDGIVTAASGEVAASPGFARFVLRGAVGVA